MTPIKVGVHSTACSTKLLGLNSYLVMYIHHFLQGFINFRHSNDNKFAGSGLVNHEMFTPTLYPRRNRLHAEDVNNFLIPME